MEIFFYDFTIWQSTGDYKYIEMWPGTVQTVRKKGQKVEKTQTAFFRCPTFSNPSYEWSDNMPSLTGDWIDDDQNLRCSMVSLSTIISPSEIKLSF